MNRLSSPTHFGLEANVRSTFLALRYTQQVARNTTVICQCTGAHAHCGSTAQKHPQNTYIIHLCKHGNEFKKILDSAGLFRPKVGAVIAGKWKILGVTTSGPREVLVDVEEVKNRL